MANMNLIGVFVTKLWPVQALACGGGGGGGGGGDGGDGGATKNIISPKFSNFGDIIIIRAIQPNPSYDMLLMSSQRSLMPKKRKSY